MQPHRYSRLNDLFEDFCTCFNDADSVYIGDVYAGGEDPIDGANKERLAEGIKSRGHKKVQALQSPDDLGTLISTEAEEGDYIICLGAGDITKWAYALPKQLDDAFDAHKKKSA